MGCVESKESPPEGMSMDNKTMPRVSVLYKSDIEVEMEEESYDEEESIEEEEIFELHFASMATG